jgi:hypothetical protein
MGEIHRASLMAITFRFTNLAVVIDNKILQACIYVMNTLFGDYTDYD